MQIAKWGNFLAVGLPAELVRELDLKEEARSIWIPGKGG